MDKKSLLVKFCVALQVVRLFVICWFAADVLTALEVFRQCSNAQPTGAMWYELLSPVFVICVLLALKIKITFTKKM